MLTGDFLFVSSVGRPDLLGDDETADLAGQLYDSVQRLQSYHDALPLYPGHGAGSMCGSGMGQAPTTTLGAERRNNPYLEEGLTREAFVQRVLESAPPFPAVLPQDETRQRRGTATPRSASRAAGH